MEQLWNIINVNVGAVTTMTRLFVEDMKQRKRGAIVNVSSGSELQPLPLMTVYAASKVRGYLITYIHTYKHVIILLFSFILHNLILLLSPYMTHCMFLYNSMKLLLTNHWQMKLVLVKDTFFNKLILFPIDNNTKTNHNNNPVNYLNYLSMS